MKWLVPVPFEPGSFPLKCWVNSHALFSLKLHNVFVPVIFKSFTLKLLEFCTIDWEKYWVESLLVIVTVLLQIPWLLCNQTVADCGICCHVVTDVTFLDLAEQAVRHSTQLYTENFTQVYCMDKSVCALRQQAWQRLDGWVDRPF